MLSFLVDKTGGSLFIANVLLKTPPISFSHAVMSVHSMHHRKLHSHVMVVLIVGWSFIGFGVGSAR